MNTSEFLSYLRGLDIKLYANGDRLRCNAPKGALTQEIRDELTERKAEILSFLSKLNTTISTSSIPPINPIAGNSDLPLSLNQKRLWFLEQLEPGSPFYNLSIPYRIMGPLDGVSLEKSLRTIIHRHEILRTTFSDKDGVPCQVISSEINFTLPVIDLRELPRKDRETEVQTQAFEEARRPFDLTRGPLLRCKILRIDKTEHILLLTVHHIVFDVWSFGVFKGELIQLYNAFSQGKPSPLPELPIQYADFALWQREWLKDEVIQSQLAYWKKQLDGLPDLLKLPTDHPRPAVQTFRGAYQDIDFPPDLYKSLETLSRQEGVTLFMTLLAAFKVLLYRYTGQTDVVVGSPVANRNREELEGLIGFFVNTLVLRTQLSGDITFRDLLSRIRKMALEAYDHQYLPFEMLVEHLQPQRDMSHSPLFQVMFALEKPQKQDQLVNLVFSPIKIDNRTSKFDLSLYLMDTSDGLRGRMEYNTDLFNSSTIRQMLSCYKILLEGIVSDRNRNLSELPMLTEAERQELLIGWNRTQRDYCAKLTVHQMFEQQAQRIPEAVAVIFEKQMMTYRQMNEAANNLAWQLRELGVCPNEPVGIMMERSLEMVLAVLGVLKAGGAYVPLDPAYPAERLSFILKDTQAKVLLTQRNLSDVLVSYEHQVLYLDGRASQPITRWKENPDNYTLPQHTAYLIYTSGSTGQPKGILMSHGALCNLINWQLENTTIDASARTLQFASLGFDVSFQEIFSTWCAGGTLMLIPESLHRDILGLLRFIDRMSVERIFVPFVVLQNLAEMAVKHNLIPHHLHEIITAGEQLQITSSIKELIHRLDHCILHNQYGPSEAHVVTSYTLEGDPEYWPKLPPIGRPISNVQIYILDKSLNPVPIGVPGELYIGGHSLAHGYLNRPELTSEKFVDNPFSHIPGTRLYNTGDMARYLTDANIEFLGRIDNQVKLRGFRIELGEIESVLGNHDSVGEAVVLLREDEPGDKRLVGYVVPRENVSLSIEELRAYLRKRLPEYMIPSFFILLESLPLTPNGKVDKQALPAPDPYSMELSGQLVEPRTPIEQALVEIWSDVLRRDGIGIQDNFFHLGGHSLLATQVISRVNETFGVSMPVAALFVHPIVSEFADEMELRMREEDFKHMPQIKPVERKAEMPLSFAQQRLWFLDQLEPDSPSYNIPLAIELKGTLDQESLQKSIYELIRRHESLRSRFDIRDGQPVQLIDIPRPVDIPVIDLSEMADSDRETEVNRLIKEELLQPFDLMHSPLLRVKLLRITEADHIMLLTIHHIVSDGWSMGVLFHELTVLYESYTKDRPSPLPELPVQYADFAVWQQNWLSGEVLAAQMSYWRQQLSGELSLLNLPTDYPYPAIQTFNGAWESIQLSKELSESLKVLSHSEHVTLFMTLLAAFKVLLYRYTGQEDIIVGSPVANRNRAEIEGLIGFFVNMLVLRSSVSDTQSFLDLLMQVRETTLGAYVHQDLPFEKLVGEFETDRDLSRSALFQVAFAVQNAPMEPLDLVGLQIKPVKMDCQTTRFELEVHVWERAGQLKVIFIYNRDLFAPSTIERMMNHYRALLEGIVSNPECRISELPLLSELERQTLLEVWNRTHTEYPRDACIHQLFESRVQSNPDAIAIVFKGQELTYSQLNEQANQLAHHLRSLGIKRGSLVAVCLERSLEMVVSMLGIVKAGGAYVPLDLSYPAQRLSFVLQDTGSNVLITREDLSNRFSEEDVHLVCLDQDKDLVNTQPVSDPETEACGNDLAYVMYTSGSTGIPKGVEVLHRGIVRLVCNTDYIQLGEADRVGHISNCSFDASTFEVWGALLSGARLVILDHETVLSPRMLADSLKSEGINVLLLTTAFFNLLAKESPQVLAGTGHLMFGGETADPRWVRRVLDEKGTGRLFNLYGPTENTTVTTWYEVTSVPDEAITVPIGRPIANTQVYVLDSQMKPVPVGVPGELYIGGDGLAKGYLNRPDLTAERFVDDPFTQGPGSLLYRTGDMVRWLPDGILEFLGRMDDQVKLRGFRIELREIESVLSTHELVGEAVVLLREDDPGDKRLVAYVVHNQIPEDQQSETGLSANQVSHWTILFNDYVYNQPSPYEDTTFNTSGWNSSYTEQPIPEKEMREWVEDAVDQILSFEPGRVLEIGCGSGLLLFRIAPHCSSYWGTDISPRAIKYIREQLNKLDLKLSDLSLFQREADDFKDIESESFDAVILNSVVQYFPDIHYLLRVLEGAVNAVKPGGFVFVGDVRSLPLLETFHTSVQLHMAEDSLPLEELRQNIKRQMMEEDELAIDPAFFTALKQHLPKISQVAIRPKRGRYHNELTQFRYQVVIQVEPQTDTHVDIPWIDWQKEKLSPSTIRSLLTETEPEILGLKGVCNARVLTAVEAIKLLKGNEGPKTVGKLREMIARDKLAGVDPEDLWTLSDELPYIADIRWGNTGSENSFNVVFKRETSTKGRTSRRGIIIPEERIPPKPWSEYANNPMQGENTRKMESQLRNFLSEKLPEYMVPTAFVFLNTLPLTPNGKVDKRALPTPDLYSIGLSSQYVEPRTPIERALVEIWSDLLKRKGIGIHDNFFHLGGHSLLATQVISRVNETFGVSIPVAALFEHPTVVEFAEELESGMRQEKFDQAPTIKPIERKEEMPLSFAQQRLWFISQLDQDNPLYNTPLAVKLKGQLDKEALQKGINELFRRHESLRTRLDMRNGKPVQLIDPPGQVDIPVMDLSEVADSDREREAHRLVREESLRPFDLTKGQLLRVKLIRITDTDHILLLMMHHIVSDGWSLGVLFHEMAVLYESYTKGRPSPLHELPIQYADFAVWQRNWLSGQVLASQMSYWRQQLSGELPVLNLPTDYPRPAIQTFNGALQSIQLSRELSESLKILSHSEHVTLFMTLLSAFKVLLYRYTGQEDIIVGSPVANRNRAEIEGLIGFFVNMLVLRSRVSGTQSFRGLLTQVRKTTLGAYTHQDLPFEKLVDEFETDRDLSRSALFQVTFSLQNAPIKPMELVGLQIKPMEMECQTTRFDLEVHVWERDGEVRIIFIYNKDLFAPTTIKRMMNNYQVLLEGIVSNPECQISRLPLMSESGRLELLEVWNQAQTDYPQQSSIPELFELQVKRDPNAVAVVFNDKQLTYSQLNERANQLAHHLRFMGVKKGSLVAVCIERSLEMVISMLGILKAGGAYVPLDVNYPAQRLSFMLQDTGSNVLLTREGLLDRFSSEDVQVMCLDRDKDLINTRPVSNPDMETGGDDLAYVMYTSGSTGAPKGVEILHRGVVRLVCNTDYIQLGAADRVAHISNCSFDASTFEVWGALLSGARLVVLDQDTVLSPGVLADRLKAEGISVLFLTTALFNLLAKESSQVLASIDHLLFGGEAADPQRVRKVADENGIGRLLHVYGPTENTTFTSWYEVSSVPKEAITVPIGRPIANTQVYVLDSQMEPVPVSVPGELYIGGDGLAQGYLNRPELTAERFVDDPFSEEQGSRLYRTGDMVRWLPEGILEFLGRKDNQVKLRGFRIELGEIGSVLSNHKSVQEAVVLLREDKPREKCLVAYVVPHKEVLVSLDDLRTYLRKRLPDYMVPSYFMQLESLPLTPNGKIDRQALPVPSSSIVGMEEDYVAPRTPMEKVLAEIWQEVLGAERVGVHENFFDLGGNSLKAMEVISKVEERIGLRINPMELMMQNLCQIAVVCEKEYENKQKSKLQRKKIDMFSALKKIVKDRNK